MGPHCVGRCAVLQCGILVWLSHGDDSIGFPRAQLQREHLVHVVLRMAGTSCEWTPRKFSGAARTQDAAGAGHCPCLATGARTWPTCYIHFARVSLTASRLTAHRFGMCNWQDGAAHCWPMCARRAQQGEGQGQGRRARTQQSACQRALQQRAARQHAAWSGTLEFCVTWRLRQCGRRCHFAHSSGVWASVSVPACAFCRNRLEIALLGIKIVKFRASGGAPQAGEAHGGGWPPAPPGKLLSAALEAADAARARRRPPTASRRRPSSHSRQGQRRRAAADATRARRRPPPAGRCEPLAPAAASRGKCRTRAPPAAGR